MEKRMRKTSNLLIEKPVELDEHHEEADILLNLMFYAFFFPFVDVYFQPLHSVYLLHYVQRQLHEGKPSEAAENRRQQMEKRMRKTSNLLIEKPVELDVYLLHYVQRQLHGVCHL
jgi:hypothetical protein